MKARDRIAEMVAVMEAWQRYVANHPEIDIDTLPWLAQVAVRGEAQENERRAA